MKLTYNILLIDDDEDEFIILDDLLYDIPDKEYKIDWVTNFDEALSLLESNQYDVALVDYRLGPESGINLIKEAVANFIETPLILMTGQEQREVDENALLAGAADYLIKGQFDARQIDRSIRYTVERARVQKKLQESEKRMALAFEAAKIGSWDWNIETDVIVWSPNITTIVGFDLNKVVPNSIDYPNFIHPDDREFFMRSIKKSVSEGSDLWLEYRLVSPAELVTWVEIRGQTIRKGARSVRMIGTIMDISERKDAVEKLQANEARLKTIISNLPIILFVLDENGVFTISEGKGLETLGLSPGQVAGLSMREVYKDVPRIQNNLKLVYEGHVVKSFGFVEGIYFQSIYTPIFNDEGTVSGVIGIAIDVTEQYQTEQTLKRKIEEMQERIESLEDAFDSILDPQTLAIVKTQMRNILTSKKEL